MSTNYSEYYQQTVSTPVSTGVEWFWETCDFSQLVISPPSSPEPIPAHGQGLYPAHHTSFNLPYLPTPPESSINYSSSPNYLPLHRSSTPPPVAAQHDSYSQPQYTPYNLASSFLPSSPTLISLNTPPSSHPESSFWRNFERQEVAAVDANNNSWGVQGIPSIPTSPINTPSDGLRTPESTSPWNFPSPWYIASPSAVRNPPAVGVSTPSAMLRLRNNLLQATYSDNDASSSSSMEMEVDVDPYLGPAAHRLALPFIRKLRALLDNPIDEGSTVIGKLFSLSAG
ncbi:hypothetical protein P7C70_g7130, partial [Phenoliferia sp. Uapishka_3]